MIKVLNLAEWLEKNKGKEEDDRLAMLSNLVNSNSG